MKVSVTNVLPAREVKFPYLVEDDHFGLVLVGRYSAIILDPKHNGDGFDSHDDVVQLDLSSFKGRWKPLDTGMSITLTQE